VSLLHWPAWVSLRVNSSSAEFRLTTHILSLDTIPTEAVHPETSSSYFGSDNIQYAISVDE
jgi:hypothetical protein